MKSILSYAALCLFMFSIKSCAPSSIRVSVNSVDANEALMRVEKVNAKRKWPSFTFFIYEKSNESEFKIQSPIAYKTISECAHNASCYQFVSRSNKHGLRKKKQQFTVSILNSKCEYPLVESEQQVEFMGYTKENRKGYDLLLNDDIAEPAPYEFARGSFFLERENPYPDPISIKLSFKNPENGLMISGADVQISILTDMNGNHSKIKKEYPQIACFNPLAWHDYVKKTSTNMAGEVVIGDIEQDPDDQIYPNLDGSFKIEIIAKKDNLVPVKVTLHSETGGEKELRYTVLWETNPNKRAIVDGYYFPDIFPE